MEALETSTAYQAASLDERLYEDDGGGVTRGDMLGSEDDGFELVEDRSAAHSAMRALDDRARHMLRLRFMDRQDSERDRGRAGGFPDARFAPSAAGTRDAARDSGSGRLRVAIALNAVQPTRARARCPFRLLARGLIRAGAARAAR